MVDSNSVGNYLWFAMSFVIVFLYFVVRFQKHPPEILSKLYFFGKLRKLQKGGKMSSMFDVPKRWFLHFYIAGVVVNTALLSFVILGWFPQPIYTALRVLRSPNVLPAVDLLPVLVVLVMAEIQMIRRTYECLFVHVFSTATMSIAHYLVGFLFYSTFGLCLLSAVDYKTLAFTGETTLHDCAHIALGGGLFTVASIVQHRSFQTLARLRTTPAGKVVTTQHLIPMDGMFKYVSSPHFLAEIIIYLGMNVELGFEHRACAAMLVFVIVNQIIMALNTHKWYKQTFSQYPPQRKAIIPFLL